MIIGQYRKKDGESLLNSMRIFDSKCVWDIMWLQDNKGLQDIYRKSYGK